MDDLGLDLDADYSDYSDFRAIHGAPCRPFEKPRAVAVPPRGLAAGGTPDARATAGAAE
jgi:hypothetical protein